MAKKRRRPRKTVLRSKEVLDLSHQVLEETLPVTVSSDTYTQDDLINSLLYAASQGITLERTGMRLEDSPSGDTTRGYLNELTVSQVEEAINKALTLNCPKGLLKHPKKIAIDITLIPYYGKITQEIQDYIIRSKAKAGTTRFFGYATLYILKANKRYTLGFRCVRKSEEMVDLLKWLLDHFKSIGGHIKRLYLDSGFYSVKVLIFLILKADIPFIMPIPKKGRSGGVRKLFKGRKSYRTSYTVKSPKDGSITVQAEVVVKYSKGKYNRKGIEYFAYVVHRYHKPIGAAFSEYRRRFGIESSYSLMNKAKPKTASRNPALRALLVGIAFILVNVWVYLKWAFVSLKRRGGRLVYEDLFPFVEALNFLATLIQRNYKSLEIVSIPDARSP